MRGVRGHNEGSIFVRKTGPRKGQLVVAISLPDGTRVRRTATDRTDAQAKLKELRRLRDEGSAAGSSLTLGPYLRRWLDDVQPRLAPATWRKYEQHIRLYLIPVLGRHRLADLRVDHVRAYMRAATRGSKTSFQRRSRASEILLRTPILKSRSPDSRRAITD